MKYALFLPVFFLSALRAAPTLQNDADHVGEAPYRDKDQDRKGVLHLFMESLGCRVGGPGSAWDSDRYLWDIGSRVQRGEVKMDAFLDEINNLFDKDYAFKDSLFEFFVYDTHLNPENSTNLNVKMADRQEFLNAVRSYLQPFADEAKLGHSTQPVPHAYRISYADYTARVQRLNNWKNKFIQKIQDRCSYTKGSVTDKSEAYRQGATIPKLPASATSPLDVLVGRVIDSMTCDPLLTTTPLWWAGEALAKGEFSFAEWQSAWAAALPKKIKSRPTQAELSTRSQDILNYFVPSQSPDAPLLTPLPASQQKVRDNYRVIREKEIALVKWLHEQQAEDALPCTGIVALDRSHYRADISNQIDTPATAVQSCADVAHAVGEKYDLRFDKLKDEVENVFYDTSLQFRSDKNLNQVLDRLQELEDGISLTTDHLTGHLQKHAAELTQKSLGQGRSAIAQLMQIDDRVPQVVLQDQLTALKKYWTENYIIGQADPHSEKSKAARHSFIEELTRRNATKLILSCLESDGRLYAASTHNQEKAFSHNLKPGEKDYERVMNIIQERKKLQNSAEAEYRVKLAEYQKKVKAGIDTSKPIFPHHFTDETDWGTAEPSLNQTSVTAPAGRYYHSEITNILGQAAIDGKNPALAAQRISEYCQLSTVFAKSKDPAAEAKRMSEILAVRFLRAHSGYKYSYLSWRHEDSETKNQVIEDFAITQIFCPPFHLRFAYQMQIHNPAYYGSATNPDRIANCKSVGDLKAPDNAALRALNENVLAVLQESHDATTPLVAQVSASLTTSRESAKLPAAVPLTDRQALDILRGEHAKLMSLRDRMQRELDIFDDVKSSPDIKNYFQTLETARLDEPGKLFSLLPDDPKNESWVRAHNDSAQRARVNFKDYVLVKPAAYTLQKDEFLANQKILANELRFDVSVWMKRVNELYETKAGRNLLSQGGYSFAHFSDRMWALRELYEEYERDLAYNLRACYQKESKTPSDIVAPTYRDVQLLQKEVAEVQQTPPSGRSKNNKTQRRR